MPTVPSANPNTLQPVVPRSHRRQSSVNTVSWTDQGDSSVGRSRPLSNNLDPSDVRYISKMQFDSEFYFVLIFWMQTGKR